MNANIIKGGIIGVLVGVVGEHLFKFLFILISLIGSAALKWWYVTIIVFIGLPFLGHDSWAVSLYSTATLFIMVVYCAGWAMFKEDHKLSLMIYAGAIALSMLFHVVPRPDGMDAAIADASVDTSAPASTIVLAPVPTYHALIATPAMRPAPTGAVRPMSTQMPIIQFDPAAFAAR